MNVTVSNGEDPLQKKSTMHGDMFTTKNDNFKVAQSDSPILQDLPHYLQAITKIMLHRIYQEYRLYIIDRTILSKLKETSELSFIPYLFVHGYCKV